MSVVTFLFYFFFKRGMGASVSAEPETNLSEPAQNVF